MSVPTLDPDASRRCRNRSRAPKRVQGGLLDPKMLWKSLPDALRKLDPRTLWRNPVMFIVEIGAVWSTILALVDPLLVRLADRLLAVADGDLRQPRRSRRGGPRQGPGRVAAQNQATTVAVA